MCRFHGLVVSLAVVLAGCATATTATPPTAPLRSSNEGGDFEYTEGAVPAGPSASSTSTSSASDDDVVSSADDGDDDDGDDASGGGDELDDDATEELGTDLDIEIEITDDGGDLGDVDDGDE